MTLFEFFLSFFFAHVYVLFYFALEKAASKTFPGVRNRFQSSFEFPRALRDVQNAFSLSPFLYCVVDVYASCSPEVAIEGRAIERQQSLQWQMSYLLSSIFSRVVVHI